MNNVKKTPARGDIPNRSELEAELARRFSKLSSQQRKRLLELLGDPPNYGNVPASFWEDVAAQLNGSFVGFLTDVYMDSAERLVEDLPLSVDWGLINQRAQNWSRQYTYDLIRGITDTSRRAVQAAVGNFYEGGQTRGDLENALARIFGPVRASAISVTEITRASTMGERAIADELAQMGIEMVPVWLTSNDELVCPICGPRHEQVIEGNDYPPAHPNCRCMTAMELKKP